MTTLIPSTPEVHPELAELGKQKGHRAAKIIGAITVVLGLLMAVLGASTWSLVSSQLAAQHISVAEDAEHFAGEPVTGPLTAYSQAQIIGEHALSATGGKTYAQMDREDPNRPIAMSGATLQASLYTSVIAFGVAALVMGLGAMFLLVGTSIILLARRRN